MIIFIDGYNMLHYYAASPRSDKDRATFIKNVLRYGKVRGHCIKLVFDGGLVPWAVAEEIMGRATVLYAGYRISADDYICNEVRALKGKDVVVISSDRQLRQRVTPFVTLTLAVNEFALFFEAALAERKGNSRTVTAQSSDLQIFGKADDEQDALMMQAAEMPCRKEEEKNTSTEQFSGNKIERLKRKL